jgi:SH3-like domain-containing protein
MFVTTRLSAEWARGGAYALGEKVRRSVRNKIVSATSLLLVLPLVTAAEQLYVTDRVTVELLSHAKSGSEVLGEAKTGDVVELLEEGKAYYKVKNADEITGWVDQKLLSRDPPVVFQLRQLQQTVSSTEQQRQALQQQLEQQSSREVVLQAELDRLAREREAALALAQKIEAEILVPSQYRWPIFGAVLIIVFLFGYLSGMQRVRKAIRQRFGGLNL